MKPFLPIAARSLHTLALALWLGGLVAIGALVAPTAFHVTRTSPLLAGSLAQQNALAGAVVGGSLRLFNILCLACGGVLLLSDFLLLSSTPRRWTALCLGTTLALLASALYLTFSLTPAMDLAQSRGDLGTFDTFHHRYENLSTLLQLPLLLLLTLFTSIRETVRELH